MAALARHETWIYSAPPMFRLCKTFEKNQNSLKETFFGCTGKHCANLVVDKCFLLGRFSLPPTGFLRFAEDGQVDIGQGSAIVELAEFKLYINFFATTAPGISLR